MSATASRPGVCIGPVVSRGHLIQPSVQRPLHQVASLLGDAPDRSKAPAGGERVSAKVAAAPQGRTIRCTKSIMCTYLTLYSVQHYEATALGVGAL